MTDAEKKYKVLIHSPRNNVKIYENCLAIVMEAIGKSSEKLEITFVDHDKIKTLEARVEKLKEALSFYADKGNWFSSCIIAEDIDYKCAGSKARAALKEDEEQL